jgi:hypothetical protein
MRTFAQKPKAPQQATPAKSTVLGRAHGRQGHEVNSSLPLQRTIGNQAVHRLPPDGLEAVSNATSPGSFSHDFSRLPLHAHASVKIHPKLAPVSITGRVTGDKITQRNQPKADQTIGATSLTATTRGLDVSAAADGLVSSPDFPDGFRWLQTVTTNDPSDTPVGAPLLPVPITYVDPRPNDDTKPFYWTDAEEAANLGHFHDAPGRPAHPTGTITWAAILSLGGVNHQEVTRFASVGYGFSIDSTGTVTVSGPQSPSDVAHHLGTLATGFPGWTFK